MRQVVIPIEKRILTIREQRVVLDNDLAMLYGVTTKHLNQAIKRNRLRFPKDFMFQLKRSEQDEVVTNCDHLRCLKFSKSLSYAFTEHGVVMAANLLNSEKAIETSIIVIRSFIKMRQVVAVNRKILRKIVSLEGRVDNHDVAIKSLISTIHELIDPILPSKRRRISLK